MMPVYSCLFPLFLLLLVLPRETRTDRGRGLWCSPGGGSRFVVVVVVGVVVPGLLHLDSSQA